MELEAELGKQLLIRGKRRITLTADGILLRKRAEEIVALLEKTEQEIASTDQDISGTVAIGGTPRQCVLEAASALHQQYSKIRFSSTSVTLPTSPNDSITASWISSSSSTDRTGPLTTPIPARRLVLGPAHEKRRSLDPKRRPSRQKTLQPPPVIAQREGIRQMLFDWAQSYADQLDIIATYNVLNGTPVPFTLYTPGLVLTIRDLPLSPTIDPAVAFRPLDPPINTSHYLVWKRYPAFSPASQKYLETVYRLYPKKIAAENGPFRPKENSLFRQTGNTHAACPLKGSPIMSL